MIKLPKRFEPKVSIVIPVYNGANYLKAAIDSALSQTYKNIEVIVINDGSTDKGATDRIARSFGDKIRYYPKQNGGVATALNYGVKKMTGEYFSWLSHDDLYEVNKIAKQVDYLRESGKYETIVACNASTLFASGIKKREYIDTATFRYTDIFLATSAKVGINGCALLIPRKAFDECGGFDTTLPVTQDYDLWFRFAKFFKFYLIEDHLMISRRHEEQDSVKKQQLCFEAGETLHYNFLREIPEKRYHEYFNENSKMVTVFLDNYMTYKAGGYRQTASIMLSVILRYLYSKDQKYYRELYSREIGSYQDLSQLMSSTDKKPRVAFFSNVWHHGGIERVLATIMNDLNEKYEFVLVTIDEHSDDIKGFSVPSWTTHIRIHGEDQLSEIASLMLLLRVDIFVGNPNFSTSFIDIYKILGGMGIKTIAYNHGHYFLPYMTGAYLYPTALKLKQAYSAADKVIWLSEIACSLYDIHANNGIYIPNPVVVANSTKPNEHRNKHIVAVGRFDDEIKQIDAILLTFKELHALDDGYRLTIVGHCPMETKLPNRPNRDGIPLSEFINIHGIPTDSIDFVGVRDNVEDYYDRAGFLLLASRCEGFALVLVEAMARGVPCAGFYYLGLEEIIEDGRNGLIRQQNDYAGLAHDIAEAIGDKVTYGNMSQYARTSATRFDRMIFKERWQVLLGALLADDARKMESLRPTRELTQSDYRTAILEYEKLLDTVVRDYIEKPLVTNSDGTRKLTVRGVAGRLKRSVQRDGVYLTGEKIIRKVYKITKS